VEDKFKSEIINLTHMVLNEIDVGTLDKIRQMDDSELCEKGEINDKYFTE